MPNGQTEQDKKNPFQKETDIPGQEPSVFERETDVPDVTFSQVEGAPEIPFLEELIASETLSPELLRTISQAQATFAPEATFAFTGALGAPVRNILARPGVITLDDVFSGELPPLMPVGASELGIGPVAGILAKSGIIPGVIRGATNITRALAARPMETVLGFVTAPATITYQALREFAANTPGASDPGVLREKFIELTGEMSPEEQDEARRAFSGLLASMAVGGVLFRTLGRPSFQVARQIGAGKATALKQARLIRAKVTGVTSLGVFGAIGGEPTEKEKNFVMFALAAIPLGLTFHAFKSIGAKTPEITDGPGRARVYQNQRAARPFNQETTVVPEVRVVPREEVKPELQVTREAVQEQVGRVLDRENIFLEGTREDPSIVSTREIRGSTNEQLIARTEEAVVADKRILTDLFGEEGAKSYERLLRQENSLDVKRADRASDARQAMEEKLTKAEQDKLFGIGGEEGVAGEELVPFLNELRNNTKEVLEGEPTELLMNTVVRELTERKPTSDPVSMVRLRSAIEELNRRGVPIEQAMEGSLEARSRALGVSVEDLQELLTKKIADLREGEVRRIEPPKAEPLVPEVLAERLDNYVRHQGDEVAIIIRNLETEPSKMVVVPGVETPARALTVAREIEGKDAIVAVHLRPDGRFDVRS